jgi:hypothetical protein
MAEIYIWLRHAGNGPDSLATDTHDQAATRWVSTQIDIVAFLILIGGFVTLDA